MTESARHRHNRELLRQLHPHVAVRVAALIEELESEGWRPRIAEAWRSPAAQQALLRELGMGADNYGLLTWRQRETLWANAGLTIDSVLGPRRLGSLAGRVPRLLPAWHVFGHKPA